MTQQPDVIYEEKTPIAAQAEAAPGSDTPNESAETQFPIIPAAQEQQDQGEGTATVPLTQEQEAEPEQIPSTPVKADDPPEPVIPLLELPEPTSDYLDNISVFCFSKQGQSHAVKDIPCQDRCGFRLLEGPLVLAAIADGVGSCALSDHGAAAAVRASLDFLESELTQARKDPAFVLSGAAMGGILRRMMRHAYEQVEQTAQELEQHPYSFQSTLTVAVYDGSTLFYAHAGDDGIVIVKDDGQYGMITTRHKGEEASSVYPLQARQWEPGRPFSNTVYGMSENVVAFIMVTDGILDSFVLSEVDQCRVFYPFMHTLISPKLEDRDQTAEFCQSIYDRMASVQYRSSVTDDLTLMCIVNQTAAHSSTPPRFDQEAWDQLLAEAARKRKAALYPPKTPTPPPKPAEQPPLQPTAVAPAPATPKAPPAAVASAPATPKMPPAAVPPASQQQLPPLTYQYPPMRQTPPAQPSPQYQLSDPYAEELKWKVRDLRHRIVGSSRYIAGDIRDIIDIVGSAVFCNTNRILNGSDGLSDSTDQNGYAQFIPIPDQFDDNGKK